MKLLVFSDSHRNLHPMRQAIALEQPDEIIHLGDHIADADVLEREYPAIPIIKVVGNCDWCREGYPVLQPTRGGVKLFLTHGHHHHVKYSYQRLEYAAMEADAQVALFGHTHTPFLETIHGMWVMNPGAAGMGCYGVVTIDNQQVQCALKRLNQEETL